MSFIKLQEKIKKYVSPTRAAPTRSFKLVYLFTKYVNNIFYLPCKKVTYNNLNVRMRNCVNQYLISFITKKIYMKYLLSTYQVKI